MFNKLLAAFFILVLSATSCPGGWGVTCVNFRRGDTNGDGQVDLSDGIATLVFLFNAGERPGCEDAADADNSGNIDLSDGIYTFQYLFLGGAPPPPPGPNECGEDPMPFDDLGCENVGPCGPQEVTRDLSNFDRFRLHYSPGFGFCPQLNSVYEATITAGLNGGYQLEMSVLRAGQPGEKCLEFFLGEVQCAVIDVLPARELTAGEAAEMLALFSDLKIFLDRDAICDCIAIDPCRIGNFNWDGETFSDFICGNRRLARDQIPPLRDFLDSLHDAP